MRTVIGGVSSKLKVGILLVRRIDPTRKITLSLKEVPVRDGVAAIAKAANARSVVVGNVIYIGPADAVAELPGVIKRLTKERRRISRMWTPTRRLAIARRRTLHWNDLGRPRDIVKTFAARYRLTVVGLDKIPHDLWASATVPVCSVTQGLSLLLVQFDLTFRWKADGSGITLLPLPKKQPSGIRD